MTKRIIVITAVIDFTGDEPGVRLNRTTARVVVGGSVMLTAIVTPAGADYTIEWTVSDERLAEVILNSADSSKATVKLKSDAKAGDKFTVTATAAINGAERSAECEVTVVRKTSSSNGGGGSSASSYSVTVGRPANGSISVSPSRAEEGKTVTVTVRPQKGYELDWLTVKDADGKTIRTTKVSDTEYTFIMPDGAVEVDAGFKAVSEDVPAGVSFSDVPATFWAYDQITWAANKGIMGGYGNGIFGPDRNTTRQALWMVLARLNGSSPADMAAARAWAVANGVSDGSNAGGAMSRQQMVTMLYRYAQMKGYATTGSASLSGYPDSGSVAGYAQEALSWAVANGVMSGTSDGRLNPTGTASRAHFAVFMYRFCNLYNIA